MNVDPATVLVVDDNEVNRDVLARRLQRQNHSVVMAENGRQALDEMQAQPFDLVLLDIMMPEMNGYEVLEHMKADPALRHVPVIVISALDEMDSVVRCIELGAEDYLTKPFNRVLLQARIEASLEKKRLHDQEQAYLEELRILQRIDRELNISLDVNRAMSITLDWALRRSDSQAGLIGLVEQEGIRVVAAKGYTSELDRYGSGYVPLDLPVVQQILSCDQPQQLSDAKGTSGLLRGATSQLGAPICRELDVIGVLLLESLNAQGYSDESRLFLTRLSDHAAIAIVNAQLYEAVQAANEAKSEFVSFVAHELKNPMASIRGYTDLLKKEMVGPINDAQSDFLETIHSNVLRMDKLVSDLSDISKIEAGQLRLEYEATSAAEALEEVVRSMQGQIEDKAQTLHVQVPAGLAPVWADHNRLVQIVLNLLSNAHKYTPPGGEIWVTAEQTDNRWDPEGPSPVIHVTVRDTGIGINAEDQGNMFQKFFRSEDDLAREVPGTGLGLNITKTLVERQGGQIWFESEYRKGTAFHFTVPLATYEQI